MVPFLTRQGDGGEGNGLYDNTGNQDPDSDTETVLTTNAFGGDRLYDNALDTLLAGLGGSQLYDTGAADDVGHHASGGSALYDTGIEEDVGARRARPGRVESLYDVGNSEPDSKALPPMKAGGHIARSVSAAVLAAAAGTPERSSVLLNAVYDDSVGSSALPPGLSREALGLGPGAEADVEPEVDSNEVPEVGGYLSVTTNDE